LQLTVVAVVAVVADYLAESAVLRGVITHQRVLRCLARLTESPPVVVMQVQVRLALV
jgi:hypothetical protein